MLKAACVAAILLALCVPVSAATISDLLQVFDPTGAVTAMVGVYEDGTVVGTDPGYINLFGGPVVGAEDPNGFYYIDQPGLANPAAIGSIVLLFDPAGYYSDLVTVADLGNGPVIGFNSGINSIYSVIFGPNPPVTPIVEDGLPVDVSSLVNEGYTATFVSDPAVPEPFTPGLTLSGLAAFVLYRRRRR